MHDIKVWHQMPCGSHFLVPHFRQLLLRCIVFLALNFNTVLLPSGIFNKYTYLYQLQQQETVVKSHIIWCTSAVANCYLIGYRK